MTASRKRPPAEDLPPTLSSMWRLCKLGHRYEPSLMLIALTLSLGGALPDALMALWFKLIGDGAVRRDTRLVVIAAAALGVSATATWFLSVVTTRVQRRVSRRSARGAAEGCACSSSCKGVAP